MSSFKLLWAITGPDHSIESSQRGSTDNVTLEQIMECLSEVLERSGLMELVVVDPSETGPRGLQIRTDEGCSIVTLAEVDNKKEKKIRTFRSGKEGGDVEILGGKWNARMVCKDEGIIRQMFTELYSTQDVSRELLS